MSELQDIRKLLVGFEPEAYEMLKKITSELNVSMADFVRYAAENQLLQTKDQIIRNREEFSFDKINFNVPSLCDCCGQKVEDEQEDLIFMSRPQALYDEKTEAVVSLAYRVYKEEGYGSAESYLLKKYSRAGLTMLKQSKLCREYIYTRECEDCAKLNDAEFLVKYHL